MFLGATDAAVERRMAGSTVVSNPEGVSCRLRGSSGGGGGGSTGNSTLLGGKRSGGRSSGSAAATTNSGAGSDTGSKGSLQAQTSGPLSRPSKPCCFCWCCCCSCSCLNVKHLDENGPTKNSNNSDSLICDGEAPPTLDEIRHWGNSFDKLMKSSGGRKVFRDFLRCEYSEENILFWLACEELKRETNPEVIEEKARKIYEDFISILSPKEVSLDSRVREIVNRNMVEPTPHTFDEAQLQIYTLMHRDSYPRFVNSSLFKNLAQLSSNKSESDGGNSNGGSGGNKAGSSTITTGGSTQPTTATVTVTAATTTAAKQSADNAAG